jgi:hypothetical protein
MRAGLTDRLAPGASFALVALLIVFALRRLRHASDMWILPVENAVGKISADASLMRTSVSACRSSPPRRLYHVPAKGCR